MTKKFTRDWHSLFHRWWWHKAKPNGMKVVVDAFFSLFFFVSICAVCACVWMYFFLFFILSSHIQIIVYYCIVIVRFLYCSLLLFFLPWFVCFSFVQAFLFLLISIHNILELFFHVCCMRTAHICMCVCVYLINFIMRYLKWIEQV